MRWEPRDPEDPNVNVSPTHPLAELATLVAGITAVALGVIVGGGFVVDMAIRRMPVSVEQRLFGSIWTRSFDGKEDERHALEADAAALLARMAAHWADNPYELELRVMEEDDPNAFAFPGGMVVVTSGLIEGAGSENELAFVLGHELGHFRERHHLRGLGRGLVISLVMSALVGAGGDVPATIAAFAATGFARDQERDADAFGLALVFREYGHVAGAEGFFERLPDADADLAERVAGYVSTHPVSEDRIESLFRTARERRYPTSGNLRPLGD